MSSPPPGRSEAAGTPPTRVMITGGPGTAVDSDELGALRLRLLAAADAAAAVERQLLAAHAALLGYYLDLVRTAPILARELEHALGGPDSPGALAAATSELAADLDLQRRWYEEAEQTASALFRPPWWRGLVFWLVPPRLLPLPYRVAARTIDVLRVLGHVGATKDLLGEPGPDAVAVQRHIRALAGELQYMNDDVLDGYVLVDDRLVPVAGLTAVQRSALGLLPLLTAVSLLRHGGRELDGAVATPVRTGSVIPGPTAPAPPSTGAARTLPGRGLAGAGAFTGGGGVFGPVVAATTVARPVPRPPASPAQALDRIPALERHIRTRGVGAVEVLRTTAQGRRHWTVVVPGTQDPWAHGPNPMDNETNLLTLAGLPSDMEVGVAAALRQAGAVPGEPVALVGHSQGGLVAARLAADPLVRAQFDITTVLTAGSPIGPVEVPPDVAVLSLEDVEDPVVAVDGQPNPARRHHITVAVSSGEAAPGEAHRLPGYVAAAGLLPALDDPGVRSWLARDRAARGSGGETVSFVFEIERMAPSGP